jgi:methylase of polypeptide subunit release factors
MLAIAILIQGISADEITEVAVGRTLLCLQRTAAEGAAADLGTGAGAIKA